LPQSIIPDTASGGLFFGWPSSKMDRTPSAAADKMDFATAAPVDALVNMMLLKFSLFLL